MYPPEGHLHVNVLINALLPVPKKCLIKQFPQVMACSALREHLMVGGAGDEETLKKRRGAK